MTVTVVAHAARSGIAALNVVTGALDTDPRTRDVAVVFAKTRAELAEALAAAGTAIVAHSFYSPDAARAADDLAWLRAHAPPPSTSPVACTRPPSPPRRSSPGSTS
jgi:sugar phosphate isomerase/epimerase